jgi:hypothetical protein
MAHDKKIAKPIRPRTKDVEFGWSKQREVLISLL